MLDKMEILHRSRSSVGLSVSNVNSFSNTVRVLDCNGSVNVHGNNRIRSVSLFLELGLWICKEEDFVSHLTTTAGSTIVIIDNSLSSFATEILVS